jgi:IS30 family transposase
MGVSTMKARYIKMSKQIHDNKHLTLDERKIIQTGIENRSNKVDIARTIGKDASTIAKEIRKHREIRPRNTFIYPSICIHNKECGGCKTRCSKYEEIKCKKRDRSPGACNKCPNINKCHLDKYFYYAAKANEEYKNDLVDFREGINLTTLERKQIGSILKPLLDQGQSLYQIKSSHPEIKQSIKTLYNYIESGVFKEDGIDNFSLKEQVNRKQFKNKYKKRKEPSNYENHKYKDYLKFKEENPDTPTTEMDTVLNSKTGPYIQTFYFEQSGLMTGFIHKNKTSESMSNTLNNLEKKLGQDIYRELFSLILTDRGVEFEKITLFETNLETGEFRTNIFYCDPYQSSQKPHVENTHNYIRDIIPNEIDISNITQEDLDLMFSHINSTPRKSLKGKTPYEVFEFMFNSDDNPKRGEEILNKLNIKRIKRDEVILKPYLLKNIYKK